MHKKRIVKFFRSTVSVALVVALMLGEIGTGVTTVYAGTTTNSGQVAELAAEEEIVVSEETVNGASDYGLADNIQDGIILHCFDWKYSDIQAELPNIAEAGFTSVQTSPAQKGDGSIWYWLYQPQTFSVQSNALGSKAELQSLCDEAEKYGINIIVDVVANHTRAIGDDGLGSDCFHHDEGGIDYGDGINRYDVTHKRIGMPDLNSESSTVQNKVKGYIEELKGMGVDGIRWDAAKHIGLPSESCQFWPVVTSPGLYNYGEILNGPLNGKGNNDALMKEYTNYISVTDDEYGDGFLKAFQGGGVPTAIGNYSERGVSKDKLVYWAESHDTYSNNGEYGKATQNIDQNVVDRAYALLAAQGKATSLYFSRPFSKDKQSIMAGAKGSTHFTSKEVAAVNHMHNACVGEKEYFTQGGGVAAVCRESGAVIVKGSGSGQVSVTNGGGLTAPGTYTDEVSGNTWTVTSTTISGTIGDSGIAVIYNKGAAGAGVSASVADGSSFTTDTMNVTFTVSNATSAKYSIDGGATTDFSDSVKLTLGEDTAFGSSVTVKITVTNEEGKTTEKTFTYKKKEAGKLQKNTVYFTKPSGWSSAKIYAYVDGSVATKLTGEWPGTAMTDEGEGVYSYTFEDSVSTCKVIFTDGTNQTPTNVEGQSCGYDYTSGKAYEYVTSWKEVAVSTATSTPKPTNTTKPTNTPKATATTKPTNTPIPDGPNVTVSMEDGASFDTETATLKLTLSNAEKGTYCVDNGPVKEFTKSANVVLGKGKIADSDVTVKVTATGEGKTTEKTYTYKKEYVADVEDADVNATAEETIEEADVNVAPTSEYYATNPSGQVGAKKTIASASDFDETMIIAQGVANDDPAAFRGTHEAPKYDLYAMYGAWDDTNLYIGLQYTNVIDVVDPAQQAPQTGRGKPYSADGDIPQMLVFDTGSGDYTDGTTTDTVQKTAWDINVKFSGDAKVDKVYLYSPKDGIINQAFFPVTGGLVDYDNVVKSGYNMPAIPGVSTVWEDGFFCSTMNGIKANGYEGYKPADLESSSSGWVDFLTTSHSTEHDSFGIVTLPLSLLGVTADEVQNNGIGVMAIASYGESGMGSLPMDMTMVDNACEAYSQDDSSSMEKEDADEVTVSLARLGGKAGVVPTTKPKVTPTTKPEDPTDTPKPTATKAPIASDVLHVNFGADRSAPQYNTTALSIKAIAEGGKAPYSYEFYVDGTSVQSGDKDTYKWQNGAEGAHTIKVEVTDAKGKTVSSEKDYDLESDGTEVATATPKPTSGATATVKPVATATEKPIATATPVPEEPQGSLAITKFTVSCKTADGNHKVGDEFVMRAEAIGANGTPLYMFTYMLNGEEVIVKNYGPENEASFIADAAGAYGFKVYVVDDGNTDSPDVETGEIIIQENENATPTPTTAPGTTKIPTEKPRVTETPDVTEIPLITGIIPSPTGKVTVAPIYTATPKPTATGATKATATPKPTRKPTPTPVLSGGGTVGKGTIVIDDPTESDYTVTSNGSSKTVEFTEYYGTKTNFVIPDAIKIGNAYYKVTSIKEGAFEDNTRIRTVTLGKNVTKIGKSAFAGCTSLQKVKGGKNVKTIGDKSFYNCKKLNSITLSSKLTTIGKSAFYKCTTLKKITIPSKVSKIGTKAFYGCKNLKTITIKTTKLKSSNVGKQAFKGIYSKATIKVPKSKLSTYKKLLKSKGVSSKAKIKK